MFRASFAEADPFPRLRELELAIARRCYRYRTDPENAVTPVASAKSIATLREIYDLRWAAGHLPLVIASTLNKAVKKPLLRYLEWRDGPSSLSPYDAIPGPYHRTNEDVKDFRDDQLFAWRRVAGACPVVIERVVHRASLAARMPDLSDALFGTITGATSLDAEIAASRVFLVDYVKLQQALRPQRPGNDRDSRYRGKYLPAPVLVLYERPASGATEATLVPVAITVDQPGTTPNPLTTPADAEAWQIAKHYVEVADNNWHFGIGHLWRCHFLMEAFSMATRRHLPCAHPIRILLDPHLRFTLFTNTVAYRYFSESGLLYDEMYAGSLDESRALFAAASVARTSVLDALPSRDLALRRMDSGLARYPYREDALAWETLVRRYVTGVVDAYYADDAAIASDEEIKGFANELVSVAGGNLAGLFPAIDKPNLIEALALALYTGGAAHSAMHFPMFDLYTYAPTGSESAYAAPIRTFVEATPRRFRDTVAPPLAALESFYQVEIGHFRYDVFGDFSRYRVGELTRAASAIARLGDDLRALRATIESRERSAPPRRSYPFLHPSLVTNSVNI